MRFVVAVACKLAGVMLNGEKSVIASDSKSRAQLPEVAAQPEYADRWRGRVQIIYRI